MMPSAAEKRQRNRSIACLYTPPPYPGFKSRSDSPGPIPLVNFGSEAVLRSNISGGSSPSAKKQSILAVSRFQRRPDSLIVGGSYADGLADPKNTWCNLSQHGNDSPARPLGDQNGYEQHSNNAFTNESSAKHTPIIMNGHRVHENRRPMSNSPMRQDAAANGVSPRSAFFGINRSTSHEARHKARPPVKFIVGYEGLSPQEDLETAKLCTSISHCPKPSNLPILSQNAPQNGQVTSLRLYNAGSDAPHSSSDETSDKLESLGKYALPIQRRKKVISKASSGYGSCSSSSDGDEDISNALDLSHSTNSQEEESTGSASGAMFLSVSVASHDLTPASIMSASSNGVPPPRRNSDEPHRQVTSPFSPSNHEPYKPTHETLHLSRQFQTTLAQRERMKYRIDRINESCDRDQLKTLLDATDDVEERRIIRSKINELEFQNRQELSPQHGRGASSTRVDELIKLRTKSVVGLTSSNSIGENVSSTTGSVPVRKISGGVASLALHRRPVSEVIPPSNSANSSSQNIFKQMDKAQTTG